MCHWSGLLIINLILGNKINVEAVESWWFWRTDSWNRQAVHILQSKMHPRGRGPPSLGHEDHQNLLNRARLGLRVTKKLHIALFLWTPGSTSGSCQFQPHFRAGTAYSQSSSVWDKEKQVNKTPGNWALGKEIALPHNRCPPDSVLFGLLWWRWLYMTVGLPQQFEAYQTANAQ